MVNGIDTVRYDPKTDGALFENFTLRSYAKKKANKQGLCEMIDLGYDENRPMIAMVTRLTEQKGMDGRGRDNARGRADGGAGHRRLEV